MFYLTVSTMLGCVVPRSKKSPTNGNCLQLVCLLSGATIMKYRPHMVFGQALPSVFYVWGAFLIPLLCFHVCVPSLQQEDFLAFGIEVWPSTIPFTLMVCYMSLCTGELSAALDNSMLKDRTVYFGWCWGGVNMQHILGNVCSPPTFLICTLLVSA